MFFVLSKIFHFIITPFFWLFCFLLIAVVYKRKRRKALISTFAIALFFSNMFIVDEFVRLWELPQLSFEQVANNYEVAIVLGGGVFYDEQFKRVNYGGNFHRYYDAMELYRKGKVKKLMISGGAGTLVNTHIKEAHWVREMWLDCGIPDEDIIIESKSRNTHENASFSSQVLDSLHISGNYLLVTSASHMRRALGCYSKKGIVAIPFVTGKLVGPRKYYLDYLLVPNSAALGRWNMLMHEWWGCITYKVAGYI